MRSSLALTFNRILLMACAAAVASHAHSHGETFDGRLEASSCPPDFTCPIEGNRIDTGHPWFNFGSAPGSSREREEIQCAIDCLDGEPEAERWWSAPEHRGNDDAVQVPSFTLSFAPGLAHSIDGPLYLPLLLKPGASMRIEGNGAVITMECPGGGASCGFRMLERLRPVRRSTGGYVTAVANNCDVEAMSGFIGSIQDLTFVGNGHENSKGIEIHGSQRLDIVRCTFVDLGTGIDLRFGLLDMIEACQFRGILGRGVNLANGNSDCGPDGRSCWTMGCVDPMDPANTEHGPRFLGPGPRQVLPSNCVGPTIRRALHVTTQAQDAAIRVAGSPRTVVEDSEFATMPGTMPQRFFVMDYPNSNLHDLAMRNNRFDLAARGSMGGSAGFEACMTSTAFGQWWIHGATFAPATWNSGTAIADVSKAESWEPQVPSPNIWCVRPHPPRVSIRDVPLLPENATITGYQFPCSCVYFSQMGAVESVPRGCDQSPVGSFQFDNVSARGESGAVNRSFDLVPDWGAMSHPAWSGAPPKEVYHHWLGIQDRRRHGVLIGPRRVPGSPFLLPDNPPKDYLFPTKSPFNPDRRYLWRSP